MRGEGFHRAGKNKRQIKREDAGWAKAPRQKSLSSPTVRSSSVGGGRSGCY